MTDKRLEELQEKYPIQAFSVPARKRAIKAFLEEVSKEEQLEVLYHLLAPSLHDANVHFELNQLERDWKRTQS